MNPQSAAEKAVSVIGSGYDLTNDIRFSSCKSSGLPLLDFKGRPTNDLVVPGLGLVVKDVPAGIKCDKGERTRFRSDVLSFNQMSEYFNKELSLTGKIPSGMFNAMFDFKNCWQKDAAATKSLAFDGWFISLYNIELERSHIMLSEHVKQQVPSSWDPPALAEFIERYGTHIVVGVKMGGKEVLHIKQMQTSYLDPTQVQNSLKQLADHRFSADVNPTSFSGGTPIQLHKKQQLQVKVKKENVHENIQGVFAVQPPIVILSKNKDTVSICVRRGGIDGGQSHKQWLTTIPQSPDVISMSLVPITSLLSSVKGCGFLNHAVNLYLRYKPPIEELHQFLEFQLPRQWAPVYADLPLGPRIRKHPTPSLQFSLMGPKLYVNTMQVDSGKKPVTGLRLYLEGKRSNHLAIHLQHLCDLPNTLHIYDDHNTHTPTAAAAASAIDRAYFEPVKWSIFSHVYTAPVQYNSATIDDSATIVTKAWFEVKDMGIINKRVLFLRLGFSMVASTKIRRSEWDGPSTMSRKSGLFSTLINTSTTLKQQQQQQQKQQKVDLNSAVYPGGPPSPSNPPKMTNFVDTKEMVRGPQDPPGYWVVTGAKLCVEGGRISIKPKYSLLTLLSEDSMLM